MGSGCRTAYGLSGCPTVHSLLHGGWTYRRAVTAEFRILKPLLHCCDIFSVMPLHGTRVDGVATQGTPGSTCHQQDGSHGADNGWMDNTLVGDSGK